MHPKVLRGRGWAVVKRLASAGSLEGWILAGGTGLALQLGHRVSDDLDFFRAQPFEPQALLDDLARIGSVAVQSRAAGTLHALLQGIRFSFREAQAAFLFPGTPYRRLVLADPRDIAVMKVVAIGGRASRKDFVDLYFFLRSGGGLDGVLDLVRRRFSRVDYNEYHLLKSLVYFEDAEAEPMPRMLRRVSFAEVKRTIVDEVRKLA